MRIFHVKGIDHPCEFVIPVTLDTTPQEIRDLLMEAKGKDHEVTDISGDIEIIIADSPFPVQNPLSGPNPLMN